MKFNTGDAAPYRLSRVGGFVYFIIYHLVLISAEESPPSYHVCVSGYVRTWSETFLL